MFTKEEKNILLEAIRTKLQRAVGELEKTKNPEIKAKKQKRVDLLISCRTKLLNLKDKGD